MKKFIYICLVACLAVSSCAKDVLNKKPLDVISDAVVWNDQTLIDAYLTEAYLQMYVLVNETPYSNTQNYNKSDEWNGPFVINEIADEATRNWIFGDAQVKVNGLTITGGVLEWWENAYTVIRTLNEFIKRVPESPVDEEFKKSRIAEARFLRAYNYFSMVKRYGGVPIITEPQDINASHDDLYRTRNTEQEVYDFILAEMDAIVNDLPDRSQTDYGRPAKGVALALTCRAALYAGSIAQYGQVQLDGVVGINSSLANTYYQKAYDAAAQLKMDGEYGLYDQDADKVTNFKNIFLKKDNIESIWAVRHDYVLRSAGGNGWVYDFFQCPKPHAWNAGNQDAPYLEMAEEFEHLDGTPGTWDRTAMQQMLWTTDELWANKDPRFFATIYTQNTPWKGTKVDFHNGLQLPDGSIQNSGSHQGVAATGTQSVDNSFGTGFGVMKYLDETKDNMGDTKTSGTDWEIFRYGEVLLNYAEAAFELGKPNDALDAVNQLRSRAGIAPLNSIDRDKIRHERKIELAFEGHRYWDLRRWRTATTVLTVNRSGLRYILDYATGKYKLQVIEKFDGSTANPVFYDRNYYLPITKTRTANNPSLVENPGYN